MDATSAMTQFFTLYGGWVVGLAVATYWLINFGGSHVAPARRDDLSLWLMGGSEQTWSKQFCSLFDGVFGERHLSLQCMMRSAIASLVSVGLIYLLLDQVLGVMAFRVDTTLQLWQVMVFAAAINILPDYLSLYETRWILGRFDKARGTLTQLAVLLADAVVSGTIIWIGINLFLLTQSKPAVTVVEMMALFSTYAVFFYSTFLTSVWAWLYCASSLLMRLFVKWRLNRLLDVENQPFRSVALVSAAIVLAGGFILRPVVEMGPDGRAKLDGWLCSVAASACPHAARLTENEEKRMLYMSEACMGGVTRECLQTGNQRYGTNVVEAAALYERACFAGTLEGCLFAGWIYDKGEGAPVDDMRARKLHKLACDGGEATGCFNLGMHHYEGEPPPRDLPAAYDLFEKSCAMGFEGGCVNQGIMLKDGNGPEGLDVARANALFEQACLGGDAWGCTNLGLSFHHGDAVEEDHKKAFDLLYQGCSLGDYLACSTVGNFFFNGIGVEADKAQAKAFLKRGCDNGDPWGCNKLKEVFPPPGN